MRHDDDARYAIRRLLESRRIVVCVGSGGVGKTTTAATLGLAGAAMGKKAEARMPSPSTALSSNRMTSSACENAVAVSLLQAMGSS